MCESDSDPTPDPAPRSVNRRSVLRAAAAGTGVAIVGTVAAAAPAQATPVGTQLIQVLPLFASQPKGTVLTLLGTAGGPQAEYVRTGTSSVLTVDGYNYLVDAGRSSVTQYLNSGLQFGKLAGMFLTHLHADHLADYYNYFLLEGGQPNAEGDRLPYPTQADLPTPPSKTATVGPLYVFGPGSAGAVPVVTDPPIPPIFEPDNPVPGIKELTERLNQGYAYSYNVFERGDGTQPITELQQNITEIAIPASAGASSTNTAPLMDPFPIFQDDRVKVSAILVPHGAVFPCFAFRFDTDAGSVVFSGDTSCPGFTAATNNVIKLAQGADVLVHEIMDWDFISAASKFHPSDPNLLKHLHDSHTRTDQIGPVAQAAGVSQLVLTHLIPSNPLLVPDFRWKAKCSVGFSGTVHVGNDRDQIPLPVRR